MADVKLKEVIENAVQTGKFGINCTLLDIVPSNVQGEDHFASQVVFAEVKLNNGSGEKTINVIIKRQQKDAFVRERMNTDVQFYNEDLMYGEILPFMERHNILLEIFPKFIYGRSTLGENYENDILVIEDLRQCSYKLTKEKLFLDFDHCALALKKLGQFHALSYSMKQNQLDDFLIQVSKLKEVRWESEQNDEFNRFLIVSMERGVLPLLEAGEHEHELRRFMEKIQDPFKLMKNLCRPEEPISVLCHGDFCRNNMVFKYDDAGKPVDARFFDLATARYASPAIDLSFFLFMNTSAELRKTHWDDLLQTYHDALSSAIPGCRVPSLDIVRLELSRKAVYGYVLCSFFIPMMMEYDNKKMEQENFATMSPEEIEELNKNRGGELGTRYISDIVRDLVKLNSL